MRPGLPAGLSDYRFRHLSPERLVRFRDRKAHRKAVGGAAFQRASGLYLERKGAGNLQRGKHLGGQRTLRTGKIRCGTACRPVQCGLSGSALPEKISAVQGRDPGAPEAPRGSCSAVRGLFYVEKDQSMALPCLSQSSPKTGGREEVLSGPGHPRCHSNYAESDLSGRN